MGKFAIPKSNKLNKIVTQFISYKKKVKGFEDFSEPKLLNCHFAIVILKALLLQGKLGKLSKLVIRFSESMSQNI